MYVMRTLPRTTEKKNPNLNKLVHKYPIFWEIQWIRFSKTNERYKKVQNSNGAVIGWWKKMANTWRETHLGKKEPINIQNNFTYHIVYNALHYTSYSVQCYMNTVSWPFATQHTVFNIPTYARFPTLSLIAQKSQVASQFFTN